MRGAKLKAYGVGFPLLGQTEEAFWKLPGKERMLLVAAYLCDVVQIREQGWNRGKWVERCLRAVGLGPGYAWCAAFVALCADLAECSIGPKSGRGRVANWAKWAKEDNRIGFKPQRGDLMYWLNKDGTGHIGVVSDSHDFFVETVEGNTNAEGSREGDGAYRKTRQVTPKIHFIRL